MLQTSREFYRRAEMAGKSLKYNPKFEKVIVNLAECYESQGNIKDAITMWKNI